MSSSEDEVNAPVVASGTVNIDAMFGSDDESDNEAQPSRPAPDSAASSRSPSPVRRAPAAKAPVAPDAKAAMDALEDTDSEAEEAAAAAALAGSSGDEAAPAPVKRLTKKIKSKDKEGKKKKDKEGKKKIKDKSGKSSKSKDKEGKVKKRKRSADASEGAQKTPRTEGGDNAAGGDEDKGSDYEAPRTQADDDFIASSDDDKDLMAEYAQDGPPPAGSDSEAEEDKNKITEKSYMDGVLASMKRRKSQELSLSEREHLVQEFLHSMDTAANKDEKLMDEKKPALAKIKLLDTVTRTLNKVDLMETLLEFDLLITMKRWMQPYADGSLPNMKVRKAMIDCLMKLPVEKEHLRRSGMGKVVIALMKHPQEVDSNRQTLRQIKDKWSRAIYSRGTNFSELTRMDEDHGPRPLIRRPTGGEGQVHVPVDILGQGGSMKLIDEKTNRVRVPRNYGLAFKIRPASRVEEPERSSSKPVELGPRSALMKKMAEVAKQQGGKAGLAARNKKG